MCPKEARNVIEERKVMSVPVYTHTNMHTEGRNEEKERVGRESF